MSEKIEKLEAMVEFFARSEIWENIVEKVSEKFHSRNEELIGCSSERTGGFIQGLRFVTDEMPAEFSDMLEYEREQVI